MSDTVELTSDIEKKFSRMIQIQAELKDQFDYKWIKVLGVIVDQFIKEHPDTKFPYDVEHMQKHCKELREEYDALRLEVAPYYPHLSE